MNGQQLAIVVVLISPVNNFPIYYVHITKEERKRKKKKKKRKTRGSEIDNKDLFWPNTLGRWGFRWFCTSLIEENNWSNTKGAKKNQRNLIKMRNAYIFHILLWIESTRKIPPWGQQKLCPRGFSSALFEKVLMDKSWLWIHNTLKAVRICHFVVNKTSEPHNAPHISFPAWLHGHQIVSLCYQLST